MRKRVRVNPPFPDIELPITLRRKLVDILGYERRTQKLAKCFEETIKLLERYERHRFWKDHSPRAPKMGREIDRSLSNISDVVDGLFNAHPVLRRELFKKLSAHNKGKLDANRPLELASLQGQILSTPLHDLITILGNIRSTLPLRSTKGRNTTDARDLLIERLWTLYERNKMEQGPERADEYGHISTKINFASQICSVRNIPLPGIKLCRRKCIQHTREWLEDAVPSSAKARNKKQPN